MNIGILYQQPFEEVLILTFILKDGIDSFRENPWTPGPSPGEFQISYRDHIFFFSNKIESLKHCQKKVLLLNIRNLEPYKKYCNLVDQIICHGMGEGINDLNLNEIFKMPNSLFLIHQDIVFSEEFQDKVIVDPALNFYYFYYIHGFQWLNFYETKERSNLIGVYNNFRHHYKPDREKMIQFLESNLGHPIKVYKKEDIAGHNKDFLDIISFYRCALHISAYLDYATSVANLIFESQSHSRDIRLEYGELLFSEKTLKAIVYQKAGIFFIYLGSPKQLEWLHEQGFWFLNSDFYKDPNLINKLVEEKVEMKEDFGYSTMNSAVHTVAYLIHLKNKLGSDTAVYNFLLEQYKDKFDHNMIVLRKLLTCGYVDKIENFLNLV